MVYVVRSSTERFVSKLKRQRSFDIMYIECRYSHVVNNYSEIPIENNIFKSNVNNLNRYTRVFL